MPKVKEQTCVIARRIVYKRDNCRLSRTRNNPARQWGANGMGGVRGVGEKKNIGDQKRPKKTEKKNSLPLQHNGGQEKRVRGEDPWDFAARQE